MKIAMDVRTVQPLRSGVGNYVLHLLRGLKKVGPEHEMTLVGQKINQEVIEGYFNPAAWHLTRFSHENHPMGDFWAHMWLPRVLHEAGVDVMHGPATLVPLLGARYATVVTVHDLVAFLYPDTIPRKYALYMRWLIGHVVKRADRIISVSQNTKDDLVDILGVNPDKISVVYEAAQPMFRPVKDKTILEKACSRYGVDGPFLYHVGNIEPRKNLVRLIQAYQIMRETTGHTIKLVITGQKGWLTGKLYKAFENLELGKDVIFTGYVAHDDLPLMMNAASAFIFPSLYEGFGLPALEAMSCGTPVVTSNISSLPEIVGDAARLVDPTDERSIAEGIIQVIEDSDYRKGLEKAGIDQAGLYSWERAASETLEVYSQARRQRIGK